MTIPRGVTKQQKRWPGDGEVVELQREKGK